MKRYEEKIVTLNSQFEDLIKQTLSIKIGFFTLQLNIFLIAYINKEYLFGYGPTYVQFDGPLCPHVAGYKLSLAFLITSGHKFCASTDILSINDFRFD